MISRETAIVNSHQLQQSVDLFLSWLSQHGPYSSDLYSLWSSPFGIRAKDLYQRNRLAGAALVAPVVAADLFIPRLARRNAPRHRFPISDAHIALGYCQLADMHGDERYLSEAESYADALLEQSLGAKFSGHCWGYPFDWMSKNGLWSKSTPLITTTPYVFEAFLALYDRTSKSAYRDVALSTVEFAMSDLQSTITAEHATAYSYSPRDCTQVINANAYRAMMLTEAWRRFGSRRLIDSAKRSLNFILQSQHADGSWWYSMSHPTDRYVDNFHSCLVLKNLVKVNRVLGFDELWSSIERGYQYYCERLLDKNAEPKPRSDTGRHAMVSREIYDYAEGIVLGVLINRHFPLRLDSSNIRQRALENANHLASILLSRYQCRDGHFATREHFGLWTNTTAYIRWPQAQIFHALSSLMTRHRETEQQRNDEVSMQQEVLV